AVATVNPATNSKLPPMAMDAFDKTSRRALLTLTSRTCTPLLQGIKRHRPEAQSPPPAQPTLGRSSEPHRPVPGSGREPAEGRPRGSYAAMVAIAVSKKSCPRPP